MASFASEPNISWAQPALRLDDVSVLFGGLVAVNGVSLTIGHGERVALLGPNGAGKTTLLNVVAGDLQASAGRVEIGGIDCTGLPARRRPSLGVARTYQRTRLMGGLTVEDNLYLALLGRLGRRHRSFRSRAQDAEFRALARETAATVALGALVDEPVDNLSHGQQRQLEIGMALIVEPNLLLLDEPASGLSRGERESLVSMLLNLPTDTTMVLIEHDMSVALTVAERVIVLANGELIASGSTEEIRSDPVVQAVYLGDRESP